MAAFGAQLDIIDSPEGITPDLIPTMMQRAAEIVEKEGAYPTDQFNNRDALNGYREIGEEIAEQIDQPIAAFCAYVGVGGCLVGVSEALAARSPGISRVAVEPAESAVLSGKQPTGTHRIEGGGVGFIPPHLKDGGYDRVEAVSTDEAFATARRAAITEGVWSGPSFGASLTAALRVARGARPRAARGDDPAGLWAQVPRRRPVRLNAAGQAQCAGGKSHSPPAGGASVEPTTPSSNSV